MLLYAYPGVGVPSLGAVLAFDFRVLLSWTLRADNLEPNWVLVAGHIY